MEGFKKALTIIKWLVVLLIIAIIVDFVRQNRDVFFSTHTLSMNWHVGLLNDLDFTTSPVSFIVFLAGFFVVGFLIAYVWQLIPRFKAKRTIKNQSEEINRLKVELGTAKKRLAEAGPYAHPSVDLAGESSASSANAKAEPEESDGEPKKVEPAPEASQEAPAGTASAEAASDTPGKGEESTDSGNKS